MESEEQGAWNETSRRRMLLMAAVFLALYTAAIGYQMFGNLRVRQWWGPSSMQAAFVGMALELVVLDRFVGRCRRSWWTAFLTTLAYAIPAFAVDAYRWLDRFPPSVRDRLPVSPIHSVYTLVLGLIVYAILMVRAINLCRRAARTGN